MGHLVLPNAEPFTEHCAQRNRYLLGDRLSKGTAITGLAELERRHAIAKVRDHSDGRRRRIDISRHVADELEKFVTECGDRLGQPFDAPSERALTRISTSDDQ